MTSFIKLVIFKALLYFVRHSTGEKGRDTSGSSMHDFVVYHDVFLTLRLFPPPLATSHQLSISLSWLFVILYAPCLVVTGKKCYCRIDAKQDETVAPLPASCLFCLVSLPDREQTRRVLGGGHRPFQLCFGKSRKLMNECL